MGCSILLRAVWRRGAAGNVVVVKYTLTSTIEVGRGRTVYLCWLFAYISWWCRGWCVINIACGLLSDLVCRTCRSIMSKLSGGPSSVMIVVPTSTVTVMIICILNTVRAEHSTTTGNRWWTIIVKTVAVDDWLVRLHADVLKGAHHGGVGLLQLLEHFHPVFGLLELAW